MTGAACRVVRRLVAGWLCVAVLGAVLVPAASSPVRAQTLPLPGGAGASLSPAQIAEGLQALAAALDRLLEAAKQAESPLVALSTDSLSALTAAQATGRSLAAAPDPTQNPAALSRLALEIDRVLTDPVVTRIAEDPAAPDASGVAPDLAVLYGFQALMRSFTGQTSAALATMEQAIAHDPHTLLYIEGYAALRRLAGLRDLTAFVNGRKPDFDVPPRIENGRTLAPLRRFAESLGARVDYDHASRRITLERDGRVMVLTVDRTTVLVDGQPVELDVPARVVDGRTLVPLRFISEQFNGTVDYRDGVIRLLTR